MRPARTVLRTFPTARNALASSSRSNVRVGPIIPQNRAISNSLLRNPTPELITRLKERATPRQLKHLLSRSSEVESPLTSIVVGILRERNELEYKDYTYILRDLRYEFSDVKRRRSAEETQESLQGLLREMKETGRNLNPEGEGELVKINILLDTPSSLEAAGETIKRWGEWVNYTGYRWDAYIDYLIKLEDEGTIVSVLEHFRRQEGEREGEGMSVPMKAKEYIVVRALQRLIDSKSSITPKDVVMAVESVDKTASSARVWAKAIRHLLDQVPNSLDTAVEVYHLARERGVETDSSLARALVSPLCSLDPPRLEEGLAIYSDYLGFNPISADKKNDRVSINIFSDLLYAWAKVSDSDPSIPLRILNDMRARGLSFPPSLLGALSTVLIRSSPDHQSAFNIYAHLYALEPQALDRRMYETILSVFISLSTPKSQVVPTALYLEIIKDMQKAGLRVGSYSITSLLHSYGLQATRMKKRSNIEETVRQATAHNLLRGISELHTMIKLDPLIEVDIPLLNALMDAYNRVGAYAEAFEVWDELVERRPREPTSTSVEQYSPSLNIIFDTCGHSNSLFRARKAWTWATRWRLNANKKNWDAYVECLCRCGEMDEAYGVVRRMRDSVEVPDPNTDTIMLLVKFSWKDRTHLEEAKEKVQREFPEYWQGVKEVLETRRLLRSEREKLHRSPEDQIQIGGRLD
jgi:pentatricopeptide repeat protein